MAIPNQDTVGLVMNELTRHFQLNGPYEVDATRALIAFYLYLQGWGEHDWITNGMNERQKQIDREVIGEIKKLFLVADAKYMGVKFDGIRLSAAEMRHSVRQTHGKPRQRW